MPINVDACGPAPTLVPSAWYNGVQVLTSQQPQQQPQQQMQADAVHQLQLENEELRIRLATQELGAQLATSEALRQQLSQQHEQAAARQHALDLQREQSFGQLMAMAISGQASDPHVQPCVLSQMAGLHSRS